MSNRRAKPTDADLEAAERLRQLWEDAGRKPSQGTMADAWHARFGTGNQSLMSQYINGRIRLNLRAVMFFAEQLEVSPLAIRDDFHELSKLADTDSRKERLQQKIDMLRPGQQKAVERLVDDLISDTPEQDLMDTSRWRRVKQEKGTSNTSSDDDAPRKRAK